MGQGKILYDVQKNGEEFESGYRRISLRVHCLCVCCFMQECVYVCVYKVFLRADLVINRKLYDHLFDNESIM